MSPSLRWTFTLALFPSIVAITYATRRFFHISERHPSSLYGTIRVFDLVCHRTVYLLCRWAVRVSSNDGRSPLSHVVQSNSIGSLERGPELGFDSVT